MKKQFGGFTPTQQQQLLTKFGYQGPAQEDDMQKYMTANPSAALAMGRYNEMARKRVAMAHGGMVKKLAPGGFVGIDGKTYSSERAAEANSGGVASYPTTTPKPVAGNPYAGEVFSGKPSPEAMAAAQAAQQTQPTTTTTAQPAIEPGYNRWPGDFPGPIIDDTRPPVEPTPVTTFPEMPAPVSAEEVTPFTSTAPRWAQEGLTDLLAGGKLPDDPTKFTVTGSKGNYVVEYADGTKLPVTMKKYDDEGPVIANQIAGLINQYKESDVYKKAQAAQEQYPKDVQKYLSGTVERDFGDIDAQYKAATKDVDTKKYELSLLNQQLQANPDSAILQQLVADKSNELNASLNRVNDLTPVYMASQKTMPDIMAERATAPTLPEGATITPVATKITDDTLIPSTSGQVKGAGGVSGVSTAETTTAETPVAKEAVTYDAEKSSANVNAALGSLQAAQTDESDPRAQIIAAETTSSTVSNLEAAQGKAILMDNNITRQIQAGELVDSTVNAEKAAAYAEQIQAAEATPSKQATVQGQLEGLMQQFEGGATPAWAAGAMRTAMQTMAARGLGASSMAGQAVIQAAMESALPIAMADAQTQAQFESQNLSNRQQRAMLAAQQRATFMGQEFDQQFQARVINASKVSDVANMNFTADQQIQLENSRIVNTMNLQNLTNTQALIMAEASALASLDMANLNNRQQAAVQNAANFLQLDLANLSNEQQTALFKTQQQVASIFSDQAAENAAKQFNAQSQNQVNQFYDNLKAQVQQFNAEQQNAQARFNAGEANALAKFNAEMKNQREQFNAANQLIVDQSNATWRREVATAETEAINRANELNALAALDISNTAYNNLWTAYGDAMENSFQAGENEANRQTNMAITILNNKADADQAKAAADAASSASFGKLIGTVLTTDLSKTVLGGILG